MIGCHGFSSLKRHTSRRIRTATGLTGFPFGVAALFFATCFAVISQHSPFLTAWSNLRDLRADLIGVINKQERSDHDGRAQIALGTRGVAGFIGTAKRRLRKGAGKWRHPMSPRVPDRHGSTWTVCSTRRSLRPSSSAFTDAVLTF